MEWTMVVPWAQTRLRINPKLLEVHEVPDFNAERTTLFDLTPSEEPWSDWSTCLGPGF